MNNTNEIKRIKNVYIKRDAKLKNNKVNIFEIYSRYERIVIYQKILNKQFKDIKNIKLLEIGAGRGPNLLHFHSLGIPWQNLYANELMEHRVNEMQNFLTDKIHIHIGNILDYPGDEKFDIILQSTVFSSILNYELKKEIAIFMFNRVKEGGLFLWYDFKYNNPKNKDVKGIKKKEIKELFPDAKKIIFHNVTLAPPIGRRIGDFYNLINTIFPFLRTHIVAEIYK